MPVNDVPQQAAASVVRDWVTDRFGGATFCRFTDSPFIGYWYDQESQIVDDVIAIAFTDIPIMDYDDNAIDAIVQELRRVFFENYAEVGAPQEAVWVVAEPVRVF